MAPPSKEPGFILLFLPPYSPNLNPIERAWKLLRKLWLHNRYFPTLAELTQLVDRQFATWARPNSTLRKLCSV
jgi:transposase